MNVRTDESAFHSELRKVRGRFQAKQLNNLAFLCSVLSPVRTTDDLFNDADVEQCDWTHVFALASNWFVAPLLFARLQQKQLTSCCPEDFLAALQAFHDANCQRNLRHREILLETTVLLNQVGITPQLLKGAHALVGKMPDHKERVISDIDILVPTGQVKLAHTTLLKAGFFHEEAFSGAVEESNNNAILHHLSPLFHPTGGGYVELHRFPSYSRHYPAVVPCCFNPENTLDAEQEGAEFLYNRSWQLLLYNQVHHYHSTIAVRGLLDIRHLAEQSALLKEMEGLNELQENGSRVFGEKISMSNLQFQLLATLFGHDLPSSMLSIDDKDQVRYREALGILQGEKGALQKRKALFLVHLIWQLIKSGRIKKRILNISWYSSRPKALRSLFGK